MKFMEILTKLVVGMGKFGDHLRKKKVLGVVVAALAFACGAGLAHALRREPPSNRAGAHAVSPLPRETIAATLVPARTATACSDEEEPDDPELEAWKNRHGGTPLELDYDSMPGWTELSESKVVVLPSGRTLVGADDTVYMLDAEKHVVWKYTVTQWLNDFAYVAATNLVYGTAGDNHMFIIDASSGRVLVSEARNGSAAYGVVLPYGDDACLIADNFAGYRGPHRGREPMPDGVAAWRGTKMLWRVDIPPDAELQVVGSRIFAVTRTKTRVLVKEIEVPGGKQMRAARHLQPAE